VPGISSTGGFPIVENISETARDAAGVKAF
jgi:hypothetical protein